MGEYDNCIDNYFARFFRMNDFADDNNPFMGVYNEVIKKNGNSSVVEGDIHGNNDDEVQQIYFTSVYAFSLFRVLMNIILIIHYLKGNPFRIYRNDDSTEFKKQKRLFCMFIVLFGLICIKNICTFFTWRGLPYYATYQINMHLDPNNCIFYNSGSPIELKVFIVIWILMDSMKRITYFVSLLTLTKLNREQQIGFQDWNSEISLFLSICYGAIISTWIFVREIPIYMPLYNDESLKFWMCMEGGFFLLTLEKMYSKMWLQNRIKIEAIHSLDINWKGKIKSIEEEEENNWNMLVNGYSEEEKKYLKEKLRQPIKEKLLKAITKVLEDKQKENDRDKNFLWYVHPKFQLCIHFCGCVSFFLLLVDSSTNSSGTINTFGYLGILLNLLRTFVYDMFDGFYFFHCFFFLIYKRINENQGVNRLSD